jgi:glycerol-3-phosphate O-acyltransferase
VFDTVAVPVWALLLVALFAALSILERVIGPSVRWFFRKRAERVVAELNKRLERPIEPFKLARRHDMIQRLKYDPEVAEAIVEHARTEGLREDVAFEQVERYAREIVPSFSASAYFGFGTRISKWVSRALYDVELAGDGVRIGDIDAQATVVFVMNHRSNMDYLLVTWLAAERSALSYAVGEWARVWPLSSLIRSMGAFFIRRRSRSALYRKVLARYVQMATAGGVTQAVFPEGGLSLDGRIAPPKLGFLSYIVSAYQPGGRDVVFVPVALNYDRVLEDRVLIAANRTGERRFRASIPTALRFALRQAVRRLKGEFRRFGTAAVAFGDPLSLASFAAAHPDGTTKALGHALHDRLAAHVPVLPVPLVALALDGVGTPMDRADLETRVAELAAACRAAGAPVVPDEPVSEIVDHGLRILALRRLIVESEGRIDVAPSESETVAFYANSIRHLTEPEGHADIP